MRPKTRTMRVVLLGAAIVVWIACFRLLVRHGTWLPFVVAGSLLAALSILSDPSVRTLLRPTLARAGIGIAGAVVMIGSTYGGFFVLRLLVPSLEAQTRSLYALLHAGDVSDIERAGLIVIVASAEEVLFRGVLIGRESTEQAQRFSLNLDGSGLARIALFGGLYAAPAAASGSPLLVVVALICGLYWGWLRRLSGSIFAPILAHAAWDLSILVLRPLL
ncbi:MAG: CPBP family intramembrane metalloprotease [Deltaproteobacteria bacterium]|nr:CPBP family intramembrane metalloprotease [Deltaproteobacteria bacterium]